jgi:hypothetical protein
MTFSNRRTYNGRLTIDRSKKAYHWLDSNREHTIGWIQIESIRLVGFEFEARRAMIGGIQISEGQRLVGFKIPFFVPRI